jgi:hypothetical protein
MLTMRRLAGKVAVLLAFFYLLVAVVGGIVALMQGIQVVPLTYTLVLLPGCAFGPGVVDAVRLHRTADPARTKQLWRRCAVYAASGVAAFVQTAIFIEQMECR